MKNPTRLSRVRSRDASAPTAFDPAIAAAITEGLAAGETLRTICRAAGMPSRWTIFRWLDEQPEFRQRFERAREALAEHLADEILEIADDGSGDTKTKVAKSGAETEAVDHEHITRSRLRVDARKWLLARMLPKKYAERVQHANDPDNPLTQPVDERELAKAIVAALAKAVTTEGGEGR